MKWFRDPRVLRILRPSATALALMAAMWHSLHAASHWLQYRDTQQSDPALSRYFWGHFQTELGVTIAAFFAGVFAWHLFKPKVLPPTQE